jgi:magnesium transporter
MAADPTLDLALSSALIEQFPSDAAAEIENASELEAAQALSTVPRHLATEVVRRLTPDHAARVLAQLPVAAMRAVCSNLAPARTAGLLAQLDDETRMRVVAALDAGLARELSALASYPRETAGALMDPRATSLRPDSSARDVIRRLKTYRHRRIDDIFLVDEGGKLVGSVALQDVVLAEPDRKLAELQGGVPARVRAVASRDEVLEVFEQHRVRTLPVVDFEGRLVGVLRQRELVRASREQAAVDAVMMVGASEEERALSSPLFAIRKRQPWLQVNLVTAFLAASVVGLFEDTIARVTALAVLLPVVAGQSGNTGAQALAVTMRGLSLREVRARQWLAVVSKEALAGAGNGIAIAVTTAAAVYLWSRSPGLALVILLSMMISMTMAGFAGAAIPMLLTALRQDPAQSSSIILTTVTDIVGFFSFLGIATLLSSQL